MTEKIFRRHYILRFRKIVSLKMKQHYLYEKYNAYQDKEWRYRSWLSPLTPDMADRSYWVAGWYRCGTSSLGPSHSWQNRLPNSPTAPSYHVL